MQDAAVLYYTVGTDWGIRAQEHAQGNQNTGGISDEQALPSHPVADSCFRSRHRRSWLGIHWTH